MDLPGLLQQTAAVSPELLAAWAALPPAAVAPAALVEQTVEALLSAPMIAYSAAMLSLSGPASVVLPQLCIELSAIDAVLARGGVETAAALSTRVCSRLDELPGKALPPDAAGRLLCPGARTGGAGALTAAPATEPLRQVLLILVRCTGTGALTARELLALAGGDLATAVAVAAAAMRVGAPGGVAAPPAQLQVRLWQILYELSTPQRAAELALDMANGASVLNDTPIEELLGQHVAHAHRLALCMAQFGLLEAACTCAEPAHQRGPVLVACLRILHSLSASEHLREAGRVLGRQLAVLWPRFGFRLLAPHLRRLLATAEGGSKAAVQASRELRRDLRTLGWLLHHCAELRQYARPLCAEVAMRVAKMQHKGETLTVAVGAAANAGALQERGGALYAALDAVDAQRKSAVCAAFPGETNRLWIICEAWEAVEELGYWPETVEEEPPLGALSLRYAQQAELARQAAADMVAIVKLHSNFAFNFLDPEPDACDLYPDWEDQGEGWEDWEDAEAEEDTPPEFQGPLGLLNVPAPPPPPGASPGGGPLSATALLCLAPEFFRCAIDGRVCSDPLCSPGGFLYERSSILAWLSWNKVCPVSGCALLPSDLVEDSTTAASAASWLSEPTAGPLAQ